MHKTFEKFARLYGPVVYFRLGSHDVVVVSSAETAEELLRHKDAEFCDRASHSLSRFPAKYIGFDSVFFPFANYDALFSLLRKVVTSELFSVAKLKVYEDLRRQEMAVMVEKIWLSIAEKSNSDAGTKKLGEAGMVISIFQASAGTAKNILYRVCVGKRFDDLSPTDALRNAPAHAKLFMDLFMRFNLVDYFPFLERIDPQGIIAELKKCGQIQSEIYEGLLREKRQARKQLYQGTVHANGAKAPRPDSCLVDVLLDLQDEGAKISDNAVMGTLMAMLIGGTDTSTTQVEWALVEIISNPDCLQRLQSEIDTVVGKERQVEESDLQSMPFLEAVVAESIRLHPVAAFTVPHTNKAPSSLGGYYIPARTSVFLNIYSLCRDPNVWKDPLRYNPDRFMPNSSYGEANDGLHKSANMKGTDFRFLPFSSGRRMCTGFNLARVVIPLTVATLVHAFDLSPQPGVVISANEADNAALILRPADRLWVSVRPRVPRHVYNKDMGNSF